MMERHRKALELLARGTVIPATPLALNERRELDEQTQRVLMRYYLDSGVGGIATAVHSTQFAIRDPHVGLFERILELVADEISRYESRQGRTIVRIAGACGPTDQAKKEALLAVKHGYDAVLLSPGGLSHLTEEELLRRTEAVAEILPVIGFYLQPAVGGRTFSYAYWERLCAIKNVVAIKAAPFDRYRTLDVVRAAALSARSAEIALYTGNDDNIVLDLLTTWRFRQNGKTYEKRFAGGLLGHWCVWTHRVVDLFEAIRSIRESDALPIEWLTRAQEVTDANAAFFDAANGFRGCIPGLHEVLRRQGIFKNTLCLDPDERLSPVQKEEIDRVYAMYPHLNDDDFVRDNLSQWAMVPDGDKKL